MQKKHNHGVVFGKFMPMHLGHEYLIETAINECNKVSIILCSLSNEPIGGDLRFQWISNRFESDKVNIYHIKEDWIPQEPSECHSKEVFYGTWAGAIKALVGNGIDALFASEDYVYPMSKYLSCEPIVVDKERMKYQVSGTKIRNNPFKYWAFINDDIKQYYRKNILIIGSESTGKSTLTSLLANYYNESNISSIGIQEYAREWIDNELNGDMNRLKFDHITNFGIQQNKLVRQSSYPLTFSDTDGIVSSIFQQVYFGKVDNKLIQEIHKEKDLYDLAIFLQPDCEWVDDGQRNLSSMRLEFTKMVKDLLDDTGIKYFEIGRSWVNRLNKSIEVINELIK